ncbi:hypothetical protein FAZ95_01820 [Trinickia violacea]|uniref:Uncharacterized protein n=1 Tax=Trinickia violacea TaxID=2571746 RepID=A0A4P8IJM7_9BURK|nr:hypothetical protein [Trinickia violacea]QCP48031.1 hypothetical protein FAZ95_01820 [Trinickia violacea]
MKIPQSACALAVACVVFASVSPALRADPAPAAAQHARLASKTAAAGARGKPAAAPAPFSFRGIALGETLEAFRTHEAARAVPVGSVAICETDMAAASLGMRFKTSDSLTIACRWGHAVHDGWEASQAVVDGVPSLDHVLRFASPDGQGPLRLYEMSFVIDEATAADLRQGLGLKYGAPRLDTGWDPSASHAAPVYVWENAVSSITLCFLPATRNATLTYLLKRPDAQLKSVERQWQASNSDSG